MWRQENENKEIRDDRESMYCLTIDVTSGVCMGTKVSSWVKLIYV